MNTQKIEEQVDLTGKTAVVTGGASGIGRAIAIALAECRAAVMIADSPLDAVYETVNEIRARGGVAEVVAVPMDGAVDAQSIVDETVKCFGGLNVLVNCPSGLVLESSKELSRRNSQSSKFKELEYICRASAEEMVEGGRGGSIINIVTEAPVSPPAGVPIPPRGNVLTLTQGLATELGPQGITVNAVAPTVVQKAWVAQTAGQYQSTANGTKDSVDKAEQVETSVTGAEEVATIVLFLVSPAGKRVTGNLVVVG